MILIEYQIFVCDLIEIYMHIIIMHVIISSDHFAINLV